MLLNSCLAMMTNYFKLAVLNNNYFSAGKSALTKHNLAVAYNAGDMIIHGTANDSKVSAFRTSVLLGGLLDIFVHGCDDYTLCDGRSDTNCVEISRYEQRSCLHSLCFQIIFGIG